jgi:hypothetical protein
MFYCRIPDTEVNKATLFLAYTESNFDVAELELFSGITVATTLNLVSNLFSSLNIVYPLRI